MWGRLTGLLGAGLLAACGGSVGPTQAPDIAEPGETPAPTHWTGVWAAAPYGPYPLGPLEEVLPAPLASLTTPTAFPDEQAVDQSFRMIVNPTLGGEVIRLRFSNLVGDRPVTLGPVRVALRQAGAATVAGSSVPVLFGGQPQLTIAPGAEAVSDAVAFAYTAGEDLAVSFHIPGESGPMTWHAVSFDTQFVTPQGAGDATEDAAGSAYSEVSVGWFFLSGVDVLAADALGSIVALGDSITDGAYQTPGTNTRYPDQLASRLQSLGVPMGVLNLGINSNTLTAAGEEPNRGEPALERFDRDVLGRAGVRSVLIFEGTNDLTAGADADTVIAAIDELTARAHAAGLCVVLGTLMPRDDLIFGWDRATMEPLRQRINEHIRLTAANGDVEGLADFDLTMRSPLDPSRPNPALYSPDLLHPTSAGFLQMAEAVPLSALVPAPLGSCRRQPLR